MKKYHIKSFVRLGELLHAELTTNRLDHIIYEATLQNPWFTYASIKSSLQAIIDEMLDEQKLVTWLSFYDSMGLHDSKTIGVIMAGNIPLVGFFDLLCVCILGHQCAVKVSSKDNVLMSYVIKRLKETGDDIKIEVLDENIKPDAVIATGSDNTNRYFRTQYGRIPTLLRGTRSSVAVLSGNESEDELQQLCYDIFMHYGLGCRNVSQLLLPSGYDLDYLVKLLANYLMDSEHYRNNYRQTRALAVLNQEQFIDGEFFILKEQQEFSSRISQINYSYYTDSENINNWLKARDTEIQCIVSNIIAHPRVTNFGKAQYSELADYPDGIDVIRFLHSI